MSSSGEPPRSHGLCASHGLPVRGDPALPSKIARPGEYKRIFLPGPETPVLHPYLVPPSREGPYPMHRVDERHVEFVRERERQVSTKLYLILQPFRCMIKFALVMSMCNQSEFIS